MKRNLIYRAIAKLQTKVFAVLSRAKFGPIYDSTDIHLQLYSPTQRKVESEMMPSPLSPPSKKIKVLVVIPFRDKWAMTKVCLDGLLNQDLSTIELTVALANNGSEEEETRNGIEELLQQQSRGYNIRHFYYDRPFNFSWLNNEAVKDCADFAPDVLAFINNDIEFSSTKVIQRLAYQAWAIKDVGAVGCTLVYPDTRIQHLFVFVGSKIVGSHPFRGRALDLEAEWFKKPRPVGAVTGAVMLLRASIFAEMGGFDENLPTSYQDVDLCLNLQAKGYVNWTVPDVILVHHETQTRSKEPSWAEAAYIEEKWGDFLTKNPFVSRAWSRKSEDFVLTPLAFFSSLSAKNQRAP